MDAKELMDYNNALRQIEDQKIKIRSLKIGLELGLEMAKELSYIADGYDNQVHRIKLILESA